MTITDEELDWKVKRYLEGTLKEEISEAARKSANIAETRQIVDSRIVQFATLFGVGNVAVLVAALWVFWSNAQARVDIIAGEVKKEVLGEIRGSTQELETAVAKANNFLGQIETRELDFKKVSKDIETLKGSYTSLLDGSANIQSATNFVKNWNEASNVEESLKSAHKSIVSGFDVSCELPKIRFGRTDPENTEWTTQPDLRATTTTMWATINTASADFADTPLYFASIGGNNGHFLVTGQSSIFNASSNSFTINIGWSNEASSPIIPEAEKYDWHINWMAIGC